jgi:integrase
MTSVKRAVSGQVDDWFTSANHPSSEVFSDAEGVFLSIPGRLEGARSPVFGDQVWDPDDVIPRRPNIPRGRRRITFAQHPAWSLRSREVAMALLNPADPRLLARSVSFGSRTFAMGHAQGRCVSYKTAAAWQVQRGLPDDITFWSKGEWSSMVKAEITKGAKYGTVRNLIQAIRDLVALSPLLTGGGIESDPWNGRTTRSIAKDAHDGETQVMAPERWIPLMGACWTYISVFADDILTLRESHGCALQPRTRRRESRRQTYEGLIDAFLEAPETIVPMKRWHNRVEPNWEKLSRLVTGDQTERLFQLGSADSTRRIRRQIVENAVANGDVRSGLMNAADFRGHLSRRVSELGDARRTARGPRSSQADEILESWLSDPDNLVALRDDCGDRAGQEISAGDVNWSMMEYLVYGNNTTKHVTLGPWKRGYRRRDLILAAARSGRTFVADHAAMSIQRKCMGFALIERPNGERAPWRDSMSDYEARCELRALRAACYVFLAAMTMMRDSELQSIKRGSITVHYGVEAIKGSSFKGRRAETPAHWWIVDEAATAIHILERLSTHPVYLFAKFVDEDEDSEPGIRPGHELKFLLEHLAATGARSGLAPIPESTLISARILRRTTACISRELGGNELAVSQQLKHVISYGFSNVTSDYMAPDPKWSNLLKTNRSEEDLKHMVQMIQQSRQSAHPLAGRGGARLTDAIIDTSTSNAAHDSPQLLISDAQLAALLKKIAPIIRFGPANACLYDEETALCRRSAQSSSQGPLLGMCQPGRCGNSVVGPEHLPVWIGELRMLKATIEGTKLSPPRRQALSERLAEVEQVLNDANTSADREQQ